MCKSPAELGFYYLKSRYYDPAICRFINADDASLIGADGEFISLNLFAYCLNNPVNRTDDSGTLSNWAKIAIGIGVIALCAAVTVATGGAAAGTVVAAVNCVASGALSGAVVGAVSGAATGAVVGAVSHRISTGSWEGAGQEAINGAADGFMIGAISGAVTGALTSPYCFVAGTLVQTEEGEMPIEEIKVGDLVWAWDEETNDVALRPVLETYINETDELVHVFVNGEEIISTPGHPFYSPVKGWTDAVHLRAGDILVLVNGEYVVVEKVQHELLEAPINVYNFNVDGYHTYYVTSSGVLVHNSCAHQSSSWRDIKRQYWRQQAELGGNDTWYELSEENLRLMRHGRAPIGWDGESVVLHHVEGIANSMDNIIEIGAQAHRAFHGAFGYYDFIDIFLV